MIDWWEIIEDPISESAQSSGTTRIEVHCVPEANEEIHRLIARAIDEVYSYRGDPLGYHCIPNQPHPRNDQRLAAGFRPVYLNTFAAKENTENPYLVLLDLGWAVPEKIQGGLELDRVPPRHGQWEDRRQVITDPNTGYLLTSSAGEIYRGIERSVIFKTLEYSYRHPTLPDWFDEAQGCPINSDTVRLDGRTYNPHTLKLKTCSAVTLRVKEGEYWREINLGLEFNPDGWDETFPNIGHYERRYHTVRDSPRQYNSGNNFPGRPVVSFGVDLIDAQYITDQSSLEYYAGLSDTKDRIGGQYPAIEGHRVVSTYVPIQTLGRPNFYDVGASSNVSLISKEVEKPVMLYPCGAAVRDWDSPGCPIKSPLDPGEIFTRKLMTEKLMRFSQFGLW